MRPGLSPNALLIIMINSTVFYILSFQLIYWTAGLSTLYLAQDLGIHATLFQNDIVYTGDKSLWTFDQTVTLHLSPLSVSFLLGALFLSLFLILKRKPGRMFFFLIWSALHSFNLIFGVLVNESMNMTDLRDVATIMNMTPMVLTIIIGGAIYFSIRIGLFFGKAFIHSLSSNYISSQKERVLLILGGFILPWILGSTITILSQLPEISRITILIFAILSLILVPSFLSAYFYNSVSNSTFRPKKNIAWISMLLMVLSLFLSRWLLIPGFTL